MALPSAPRRVVILPVGLPPLLRHFFLASDVGAVSSSQRLLWLATPSPCRVSVADMLAASQIGDVSELVSPTSDQAAGCTVAAAPEGRGAYPRHDHGRN